MLEHPTHEHDHRNNGQATWRRIVEHGFFADAIRTGSAPEIYKAAIQFAALVRRRMSASECRRASVELILEADEDE